ncbi:agmatine deiminase [Desulfopila aestuarii DSM 18488]|uniref:Agmatine deiminase n=1 Tax=Desulfopila aestuarii DSM 18488 TaxID=1121416 RepID=A0A1M7Y3E9_9BACT|nr:agmatine deiminase family protein [Desulfopila aestuarii]SHO46382.1 agmatine deiminase [Desulfopila aestuarii DSM 18488]
MIERRLPAEWEPQDAVLLGWPHETTDWADMLDLVLPVFIRIAVEISLVEMVIIPAPDPDSVRSQLAEAGARMDRVRVHAMSTNDTWARDFGPITIYQNGTPLLLDYGFNGWGLKFPACDDNQVTARLQAAGAFGSSVRELPGLILEGGSLESDGNGTVLTTSACLLEANRNPHLDKTELDQRLRQQLGADHVLWLEHGYLAGDDTDSHIDTLARLAPENGIIYQSCDDPEDEHYAELTAMAEELATLRTREGQPFKLYPLPWPEACYADDGHRLPATYANFLILNTAVLVPVYNSTQDESALAVISRAFPDRKIVAVPCRPLIEQHGSLHCVTMQIPQGVLK